MAIYDLSLIVCTRNRARQLPACLEALARQDYDPRRWQLIIVDNGSTDDTHAVAREFATRVLFHVVILDERLPGQSHARNAGMRAALAPLVAFTDDDCYAAPDFVRQIVDVFHAPGQLHGYAGGRILLHDPTDAPETIRPDAEPADLAPGTFLMPGVIHGANMAFRRSLWSAIGGFDVRLGPGTRFVCDDVDFLNRASLAGYHGAYRPEPVVRHHHGRKPGRDVDRLHQQYARGRGAYYAKGLLTKAGRDQVTRRWYWHLRTQWRRGRYRELLTELSAAGEFLLRYGWREAPVARTVGQSARPQAWA